MSEITRQPDIEESHFLSDQGPSLDSHGVTYRVWAPPHRSVRADVERSNGEKISIELKQVENSGYFFGLDASGRAGDFYTYSIDGAGAIPDFVSHYQPGGVFGRSMVVDARAFNWRAIDWKRPAWNGQVVYECHVGTFTTAGTFQSAVERLDYLLDLGVTALEIMPVADWAGERNWGYDGVMLFAPSHAYGTPDDFRALVDACHLRGLAVILDIVYNHLGAEGNFSHQYSHFYFHEGKDNPWGQNFNLDGARSEPVRALLRQNLRYWLEEFRIDGFRMDATHTITDTSPVHVLAELAELVHQKGGFIIAEDDRNSRSVLEPRELHGWNFNALWSDDYHHSMRVSQTGEQQYFLSMFSGKVDELAEILRRGWLYSGQYAPFYKKPRGTPADDFSPERFVCCISNHDQVGNRLKGERLHECISSSGYRAISLFLCLVPYTPLIFMGQEWAAGTPFDYFTDMPEELGRKIEETRKQDFLKMGFASALEEMSDFLSPQHEELFKQSKLNWSEIDEDKHRLMLDLYRAGLALRKKLFQGRNPSRDQWEVQTHPTGVALEYRLATKQVSVRLDLRNDIVGYIPSGNVILRSNAPEFAGEVTTKGPETIVINVV